MGNATGILTKFYQNPSDAPQELSSSVTEVSFEGMFTKKKKEVLPLTLLPAQQQNTIAAALKMSAQARLP